jgi:hypothetical protein
MTELSLVFREAEVASILPFVRKTGIAFDDRATRAKHSTPLAQRCTTMVSRK